MQLRVGRVTISLIFSLLFGLLCSVSVFAATGDSESDNYKATETVFGSGGGLGCNDSKYCAQQSLGESAIGGSSGGEFGILAGKDSSNEPTLEVYVEGRQNNLGIIEADTTATGGADMSVRSYLSSGYIIRLVGLPPHISEHTITNLATPTTSQTGIEQFGFNLVENSTPNIGANPVQVPDDSYAFGEAATNYDTANYFTYNEGDIIAQSSSSTGQTNYALSFILNVSPNTPAGLYVSTIYAVIVPMY